MARRIITSNPEVMKSQFFLDLIASKWTICVMYELSDRRKRYNEIQREIGVTQKSLSVTLRKMERDGIIKRIVYPVIPPRVEYELTSLGKELLKMITAMAEWSANHCEGIKQSQLHYDDSKDQAPFWMQPRDPNAPLGM